MKPPEVPETPTRDQNKFVVRMPDGMREQIAEAAKQSNRSMNAEIVHRLQWSLDIADASDFHPNVKDETSIIEQILETLRISTEKTDKKIDRLKEEIRSLKEKEGD